MKKLWVLITFALIVLVASALLADTPVEGRSGRAEVHFLQGMIDHHQMGVDMANDCLAKASTEVITSTCQTIMEAQTAEIALMQGWLLDWYEVAYYPMSMDMMQMGMSDEMQVQMETMMGMDMPDELRAIMEEMRGMMSMMMSGNRMSTMGTMPMMQHMSGMLDTMIGMEMSDEMHTQMTTMRDTMRSTMTHMEETVMPPNNPMMMGMMMMSNRLQGADYEIAWLEAMIDHHDDAIHMSERLLNRVSGDAGHAELQALATQIITEQRAENAMMEQILLDFAS